MSQILVRRGRSALSALCLSAICGVAFAPAACTIIKDEKDDDSAQAPHAGSAGSAGHGEIGGESAGGAAGSDATAGAAAEEGGAGGDGGAAVVNVDPPASILDGDVRVSCTVACEVSSGCAGGAVFVSACAKDNPGTCYEITPIDDPSGKGNTYIISIDPSGHGDVIENSTCSATTDSKEQPPVDLLFAIDTTSSMGNAIEGVVASIDSFVSGLAKKGVKKMRIGGIAFGDVAPLTDCAGAAAPFVPFTDKFGADTRTNSASFNYWLSNLSDSHCDDGGGDDPEGGIDALEFALGHETSVTDQFTPTVFEWDPNAVHQIVVITDTAQHQKGDDSVSAHYTLAQLTKDVRGFATVHVVGPNLGCYNTPAAGCACDVNAEKCDTGCACDLKCATPGCAADEKIGSCDNAKQTCDRDCAGFNGAACDKRSGICDPVSADKPAEPCAADVDCASGVAVDTAVWRRCQSEDVGPYADVGALTLATGGAFTLLPDDGDVDLTALPLTGVIASTEKCSAPLPADATAVRCVYQDKQGHQGEVVVDLAKK